MSIFGDLLDLHFLASVEDDRAERNKQGLCGTPGCERPMVEGYPYCAKCVHFAPGRPPSVGWAATGMLIGWFVGDLTLGLFMLWMLFG